jgi:flagellar biogenesis protein FliO
MHLGQLLFLLTFIGLFSWLFYKGYKAYKKNGWDDPFFKDGIGIE